MTNEPITQPTQPKDKPAKSGKWAGVLLALLVLAFAWMAIRPGVFTVQPLGAFPDGITVIYHSRNTDMPFFASPDGLCLQIQGSVSLLCRAAVLGEVDAIAERVIVRLPYSHWAYLRSTGGLEFEQ